MKSRLSKIFFFVMACFSFFQGNLFAENAIKDDVEVQLCSPFALNLPLDLTIAGIGAAGWAFRFYKTKIEDAEQWDGTLYDKSDINAFDRWASHGYSESLDNLGTALCALSVATPLFSVATSSDYVTSGLLFAETMLFASGTYSAMKTIVRRNRPYMYFDGGSEKDMDEGDFINSFPSGHTTNAFAAAVFAGYTFSQYNPDSALKIPVWITSLTLASATGAVRILSGNHFPSDVLAGALIGSASGFLVPYLHKQNMFFNKNVEVSALPMGIFARVKF